MKQIKGVCIMKDKYITPEMDIIEFESEDVITTSLCSNNELPFMDA